MKRIQSFQKFHHMEGVYRKIVNNNFIKNASAVITGTQAGKLEINKFTGFKKIFTTTTSSFKYIFKKKT